MSTARVLLDSNILILASQGLTDMQPVLARYEELLISVVS